MPGVGPVMPREVHSADQETQRNLLCDRAQSMVDCLIGGRMAHRNKSRSRLAGHRHTDVAASLSGEAPTPTLLHSVETRPPVREGSLWGRRRVLLLNSTYEPLTALPMRRAVVMLMCGKADVVHADPSGPVIHSASRSVTVPSVIRLRSFVRGPC